ncbi:MAG: hypothetical protein ABF727_11970 [Gluconobacter oxydans]
MPREDWSPSISGQFIPKAGNSKLSDHNSLKMWALESGSDHVTLRSKMRMPHSSRRTVMDEARKALREALQTIRPRGDQIIEGVYSSSVEGYFDVENVVIYNIETASFNKCAINGIRARRDRSDREDTAFSHTLRYTLIDTPKPPVNVMVHLRFAYPGFRSVFDIWWSAVNGELFSTGLLPGRFGIHVDLSCPTPPKNPAKCVKILFDGIIAALQINLVVPVDEVVLRLSRSYGVEAELLRKRIFRPLSPAIMATRKAPLVAPYREHGVQWHPADDKCEDCTFVVSKSDTAFCDAYLFPIAG